LRKLAAAFGAWLLRQQGWHLALSLWYMLFPIFLAGESFALFDGGGYTHRRVDLSALLLAVAIALLVPPVCAAGLARNLRRGWRESGLSAGNDGRAAGPNNGDARG
jgi:hypothetical protein